MKREKKDKNAPKRAISAFFFFQKARRETLKKEGKLSNKEMISKMSEEWNRLTDSDKQPYIKQAEKDKARYEMEMKNYDKKKHPEKVEAFSKNKKKPAKKAQDSESEEDDDVDDDDSGDNYDSDGGDESD